MSGVPQTMPAGVAVAIAWKSKGICTQMFWLTENSQNSDGIPGQTPINGSPAQNDIIVPTSTLGVIIISACTHTVS
jgi:hypothetical protein